MRAVVQRVSDAGVEVDGVITGRIDAGLLVYLGVGKDDTESDVAWMADKIANLRIYPDNGKMDLSILDTHKAVLLVSQFTLCADCRKGRRPSFDPAAPPHLAATLYKKTAESLRSMALTVETGSFGEHMNVTSTNNGPVTFLLDTKKK